MNTLSWILYVAMIAASELTERALTTPEGEALRTRILKELQK